jgi:urate oxidase
VRSEAVQHTLYDMGSGVLAKVPQVEKIHLYMVSHSATSAVPLPCLAA